MTDQEAIIAIGERAEAIAKHPAIRKQAEAMFLQGKSMEEIKQFVYNVAIATLYGCSQKEANL